MQNHLQEIYKCQNFPTIISVSRFFFICAYTHFQFIRRSPCNIVANMLDCDIVVSKFELQSHYYIHFKTNALRKGINPLITPAMG